MPKKILICEDDERLAKVLSDLLKDKGYEPFIELVEEKSCTESCIEGRVQEAVLRTQPDYFITDGLRGRYDCVIEAARRAKPDIISIVFSASEDLIMFARDQGYVAFQKPKIEGVLEFIGRG